MLVILRDGKKLQGVLRSYDQFGEGFICIRRLFLIQQIIPQANLVLEDTYERIYHGTDFAERWIGVFVVRGENVVLLGEIVRRWIPFLRIPC